MKPISTSERLPEAEQVVLWWHPVTKSWRLGSFQVMKEELGPGRFQGGSGWYVSYGPTYWMPEPPPPEEVAQ